jgi:glycosyltransferase involved in cell wall biosynthesis
LATPENISLKISVIVPLYNGGKYIEACLNSILSQTYDNFEIIVVDDGSTDDGYLKVHNFCESLPNKVQIFQHSNKENKGIAQTRNLGIAMSTGQLIALIDQDDIWLPEKLSKQIYQLNQNPEAKLIYSKADFIDDEGKIILFDKYKSFGKDSRNKPTNHFIRLLNENIIPSITVMFYKDCLGRVGYFTEGPRHEYEDWIIWTKIATQYKLTFVREVLAHYRIHSENYSSYRLNSGLDLNAEKHYIECIFKFLLENNIKSKREIHRLLTRRIWRFLFRAKSWGAENDQIKMMGYSLATTFPFEKNKIRFLLVIVSLLNPHIAKSIRRLRRRIIGI